MAGIFATSGACILKAGPGMNALFSGALAETNWNILIAEAESYLNAVCRYNFSDTYASLNVDKKYLLEEATSNLAAINAILYNTAGYENINEAEDKVNFLWARTQQIIALLKDQKVVDFINGA